MAYARTPLADRFDEGYSVDKVTGCWNWVRSTRGTGYGQIGEGGRNCKILLAHRVSYELHKGKIPDGLDIDHLCRNRACVNPQHLEAVTRRENLLRGSTIPAMRAAQTHCLRGHPFDADNTRIVRGRNRECKTCRRDGLRRRRASGAPQ